VPVIAHKFFETDLPFGLVTFKDIALLCGVPTPLIDAIIIWNQKLINKEYIAEVSFSLSLSLRYIYITN
jgi:hypothetical protein